MPKSRRDLSTAGARFGNRRMGPELSVVVPVYDEEEVLPELIHRVLAVLDGMRLEAEVIFVDDGSSDDTAEILERAAREDSRVKAVCFSRNFGHQAAISAGLAEADGDAVVVMDGDLQDPPEAIPALWERLHEGFDVVYAIRSSRPEGWPKRAAYTLFYRLLKRSVSLPIPLDSGDFGIMSRRVVDVLNTLPEKRRFVRGLRAWAGFRQCGMAIDRDPRAGGRPKYTWGKLFGLAMDGLVGFSEAPLRIAGAFGLVAMLTAGLAGLGLLAVGTASTWPWIALLVLFFGGAQLFSTAVLGEYVCRTLQEVRGRPGYVVGRRLGADADESSVLSGAGPGRFARPRG